MQFFTSSILETDVAIVGGGVAGSSLGATLAAAGIGVVIVEREARFRDRIRGEGLHPWGAAEANRLGLTPQLEEAGGQPLPVWQRYDDRLPLDPYHWADDTPGGHVEWGVSHPDLQESLLRHAAGTGARLLRPARAIAYREVAGAGEIEVAVGEETIVIRARLVVGADGSRALSRSWIGAATHRDPVHHAIGGCLLDGVCLDPSAAHQAHPPGAMTVVFPRGGGKSRLYYVCDPDRAATLRGARAAEMVAVAAEAFPDGAFAHARIAGPIGFFPGADLWADRLASERIVLIGDAAGANDPSQGHGLSLAFRDAHELSKLLIDERRWPRAIAEFGERRQRYFAPLRAHAQWVGVLWTEQGIEADRRRERAKEARADDPSAGGFALIHALGPDGLTPDEAARRHFFGEDLRG
ncbi:MAG: FAD-dependent monooxygenase [Chloroflexota bacterium]|nr:FAD-dependent monooxygenase [Chloroflexota bacterium]